MQSSRAMEKIMARSMCPLSRCSGAFGPRARLRRECVSTWRRVVHQRRINAPTPSDLWRFCLRRSVSAWHSHLASRCHRLRRITNLARVRRVLPDLQMFTLAVENFVDNPSTSNAKPRRSSLLVWLPIFRAPHTPINSTRCGLLARAGGVLFIGDGSVSKLWSSHPHAHALRRTFRQLRPCGAPPW